MLVRYLKNEKTLDIILIQTELKDLESFHNIDYMSELEKEILEIIKIAKEKELGFLKFEVRK